MRTLDELIVQVAAEVGAADVVLIDDDPTGDLLSYYRSAAWLVSLSPNYQQSQTAQSRGALSPGERRLDEWLKEWLAGENSAGGGEASAVLVGQMPKSLARLEYVAASVAAAGFKDVCLVLGANNKHLSRGMNTLLERYFEQVHASRGKGKFRCLVTRKPKANSAYQPQHREGIYAVGGVFSGPKEDYGGQLLGQVELERPRRVLDLGCGNGSVARRIIERYPTAEVIATDNDADAVNSARLTLGNTATVTWDDAGSHLEANFDAVLLNPPFHEGTTVDATLVRDLLDAAYRLLLPGGQIVVVHNSHLRYRPQIDRRFEASRQVARNQKFTLETAFKPE